MKNKEQDHVVRLPVITTFNNRGKKNEKNHYQNSIVISKKSNSKQEFYLIHITRNRFVHAIVTIRIKKLTKTPFYPSHV